MNTTAKIFKALVFAGYVLILAIVVGKIFFEPQFNRLLSKIQSVSFQPARSALTIGYSEPFLSLSPFANDVGSRARAAHLYEALVRMSPDLQIQPALAISYGVIDDTTWEFRLRPKVKFHNGDMLTVDDVIFSLNEAKRSAYSQVKDFASSIKEINKISAEHFRILTHSPDSTFLKKLSFLFIVSSKSTRQNPIGTGPYEISKVEDGVLELNRFADYWGQKPSAAEVRIKTFLSKEQKQRALAQSAVDILANVPPEIAHDFKFPGYSLKRVSSLEVSYLMFNFTGPFQLRQLREAVALAVDKAALAKLVTGFMTPAYQFVGSGIFGFNPEIRKMAYNPERAKELAAEVSQIQPVLFDLPKGLEVFGANLEQQLKRSGIEVNLNFLSQKELSDKISARQSNFYFFGWRAELGDALDFLTAVAHSRTGDFGHYNGGNYKNEQVDSLIEQSLMTIKDSRRLEKLREAMKIITADDIIGVPLFNPESLYAVADGLNWKPRVDGYILAQEVKM